MTTRMRCMMVAALLLAAVAGCGDEPRITEPEGPSFGRTPVIDDDNIPVGADTLNPDDGYFGSGHQKPPPDTSSAGNGPSNPG